MDPGVTTRRWHVGDVVLARGERCTIRALRTWPDCTSLRLSRSGAASRTLLVPFDRPHPVNRSVSFRSTNCRRWLHEVRRMICELQSFGSLKASAGSIRLVPYQLEPAISILRYGATRVLIADGVGLGKTIQSGVVIAELAAVDDDFRGLVVCPAGLRDQWARELASHFALNTTQADAGWLRRTALDQAPDVNPWSMPGIYIASLDFIKRPEVLAPLEDVTWDLLVIDEAHQATSGTDRRAAAHAVGVRSRRLILLTATPHADDPQEFDALARIGRVDADDDPAVCFRRTRGDVAGGALRRSVFLRVRLTAAEQRMHELLERYTARVWAEARARGDARAKLVSIILRKRALSSPVSLATSVRRRLDLLSTPATIEAVQLQLPLADEDPLGDAEPSGALAAPGLADPRRERRWLASIAEAAQHASRVESKARALIRFLARVPEPVIVFTEYRDTLARLERIVSGTGRPVVVLHGGMEPAERARIQRRFNEGIVSLIATDAASEGLNLHHRCRLIVHYELPWSAARIEQRAGRVDRLGQTGRVHEIALIASGTAERLVLAPLAIRAARARSGGRGRLGLLDALTESRVAELVMEGIQPPTLEEAAPDLHRPDSVTVMNVASKAADEVRRLETMRAWRQYSPTVTHRRSGGGAVAASLRSRRSTLRPGIVLLFVLRLRDEDGASVHAEPAVLQVPFTAHPRHPPKPADLEQIVRELSKSPDSPLRETIAELVERMADATRSIIHVQRSSLRRREEALTRTVTSAARELVQAGLFDRRQITAALRRERATSARLDDGRSRTIGHADPSLTATADLAAVLTIAGRRAHR
jgi:superfamily II DNA or RNA helicase